MPIERQLAGGEVHAYHIGLAEGQYLHVVVDQRGIHVAVAVFRPDGQPLIEAYSLYSTSEPESLFVGAEASGTYHLVVRPVYSVAAGRYDIRIQELRDATPQDKDRIAAEGAVAGASRLYMQGTADSRREAISRLQEALLRWQRIGNRQGEAKTLNLLGAFHVELGELQKAFDYFHRALSLLRTVGDRRWQAYALHDIGTVYRYLGEPLKALSYYDQSLQLCRAVGERDWEAISLGSIASVYQALGENQRALHFLNEALPLVRAVGNRSGENGTLAQIGEVYHHLGEHQKALDYLGQALGVSRTLANRYMEAMRLTDIGWVYTALGNTQKALEYYGQALPLWQAAGNRQGEASALAGIARVERDRDNLSEARRQIETALAIIESLRAAVTGRDLRTSYLASVWDYYELYIDVLMRLDQQQPSEGHATAALQASERARARSMMEMLHEARADIQEGVDPELLALERRLQQQLNQKDRLQIKLLSGPHTEAQASVKKELDTLLAQYQELEARIRATSPRYAALTQPQPLSLKEIQQQVVDDGTLLLEYALGTERSFLWAVTPSSITSVQLPKRSDVETGARRAYELMKASNSAGAIAQAEIAATNLSQMLLGPIANKLGKKRLLIASDGALQYVPFAALPDPAVSGQQSSISARSGSTDEGQRTTVHQPLIVDHEIVNLPSASVLAVLRRELAGRQPAANSVAVLADPVFDPLDKRVRADAETRRRGTDRGTRRRADTELRGHDDTGKKRVPEEGKVIAQPVEDIATVPASSPPSPVLASDVERSAKQVGLTGFPRLQFTRREAEAINSFLPKSKVLNAVDFLASRATATSAELGHYRVVHFATHALLNSQHPELSGIVLSLVDERGQPQDGFLRAHEIYNLKLPADLVVLSGCQTALGKEIKGEGLISLTRGFMYAGAARVMVSLWNISDEATAELMKRFYRGMLKEDLRPAAALRAAQVSMWREKRWEAPYYWAAFILQGEWR